MLMMMMMMNGGLVRDPKLSAQQVPRKSLLFVTGVFRRRVKDLRSSGMLTQRLLVVTDVSGEPIGHIFKGRRTHEGRTDKLSLNGSN